MLVEHRLGIKQVHLAGAAVHEKVDNGRGPGREVRRARLQVEGESRLGCRRRRGTVKIARQQIGQRRAMDAAGNLAEKASPRDRAVLDIRAHGYGLSRCRETRLNSGWRDSRWPGLSPPVRFSPSCSKDPAPTAPSVGTKRSS